MVTSFEYTFFISAPSDTYGLSHSQVKGNSDRAIYYSIRSGKKPEANLPPADRLCCRVQHVLDEDPVPSRRVIHQHVSNLMIPT